MWTQVRYGDEARDSGSLGGGHGESTERTPGSADLLPTGVTTTVDAKTKCVLRVTFLRSVATTNNLRVSLKHKPSVKSFRPSLEEYESQQQTSVPTPNCLGPLPSRVRLRDRTQ